MSKSKKMIPILVAASLTAAVIPITSSYAEETLGFGFQGSNISTKIINDNIDIKKVEDKKGNGFSKVIETFNESRRKSISSNEATSIAYNVLKTYCSNTINNKGELTTRLEDKDYVVTIKGSKRYIKISDKGLIKVINTGRTSSNYSGVNNKDINRAKEVLDRFLKEYFEDEYSEIRSVLTSENNTSGNNICFNLQRVHNNIEVLGEGGSIIIDASDYSIKSFNMNYSEISFEKETFGKISKDNAISIIEGSSNNGSKYINNNGKYELDFALRDNRDYLIDVKNGNLKDEMFNEYTLDGKISSEKSIKEVLKDEGEIVKTSEDIVKGLTGYDIISSKSSTIKENKKSILRCEVKTKNQVIYYVEYDKASRTLLNVYQNGYDSLDKKISSKISFEKAYKRALSTIGFLYKSKSDKLSLNQSETDMVESNTYTFKFNRIDDGIPVDGQYICINIDAKTGQVISSIIEWNEKIQIEKANKRYIQKKRREYLESLRGQYVYIKENNTGKLYYKLSSLKN